MSNPLAELLDDAKSLVAKIEAHMGRIEQAKTDAMQFLRPPAPEEQAATEAATTTMEGQRPTVAILDETQAAENKPATEPSAPAA